MEDSERIFAELILSIEKRRSEVTEVIRAQEKAELAHTSEVVAQLEKEIADIKRRQAELEKLSQTSGYVHFLQVTSQVLLKCRATRTSSVLHSTSLQKCTGEMSIIHIQDISKF